MERYLERVANDFFEPINSYKVIQAGWTNLVIEINDKWIFRFVRDSNNTQLAVEQDFLPRFERVSPLNVPCIVLSDNDYIAYPKIAGTRFSPQKFSLFSSIQRIKLIKLLGEFLTCLHNFQFTHQYLSEAPYGGDDFWNDLWFPVKDKLCQQTRNNAEKYFIKALEQIQAIPFTKTLTHSDLGTNNILVNFERCQLEGIIDFGDLCLSDPAADFAGFYRNFGHQFVEDLLHYYQRSIEANFWTRIKFESKRKMFFVAYFALNYGYESHVSNILQNIEKLFQDDAYE